MSESFTARLLPGADERLARGVVAGLGAGLLFLLANMWYADSQGMPAVAPLYDISTIFHFTDKPEPSPENLAVGLITHLTLSAAFGATFALLAPLASGTGRLVAASAIFGLLLYLVNFQILGRLVFEWFQEGPDQTFELFAHLGYGLLLAPFTLGNARPREARVAAPRGVAAAAR
jgi:hypothetical protein